MSSTGQRNTSMTEVLCERLAGGLLFWSWCRVLSSGPRSGREWWSRKRPLAPACRSWSHGGWFCDFGLVMPPDLASFPQLVTVRLLSLHEREENRLPSRGR